MTGTSHEDRWTFVVINRQIFLRMKNVSDKNCRESQATFENRAVYEILGKNVVDKDRPQMTMAYGQCMLGS